MTNDRNLVFAEGSRLVWRAALKLHSAHHGLGSKTVEQEPTEGTEVLRYLCYLLFCAFSYGYAALFTSVSECIYRFCQQAKESMVFSRRFRGVLRPFDSAVVWI